MLVSITRWMLPLALSRSRELLSQSFLTRDFIPTPRDISAPSTTTSRRSVGMNEACLNAKWLRKSLTEEEAQKFTKDVLNHMRNRLSDYQEKYGDLYNLEATPAESTSYRLAKHDLKRFPDIITAGTKDAPYYTNSTQLPVNFTDDPFVALEHQEELQRKYTGGTMLHLYMGEPVSSGDAAQKIVRTIIENYKVPYMTLTPTFSICPKHGYLPGKHEFCPKCDAENAANQDNNEQ